MKQILLLSFILLILPSFAQPTFNASDLNFIVGETFVSKEADTTGIFQGGSGANQVWNFTLTASGNEDSAEVVNVNSVAFSGAFPSANIVIKDSNAFGDAGYTFFNQSNDSLVLLGFVSVSSFTNIDTIIYNNPSLYHLYPFTYLSTYNDFSQISLGSNASINKSSVVYDAYGNITINGVLFSNVIRKHQFDTTFFGGSSQTTIYYETFEWLTLGEKVPLLTISYFRFGITGPYEKNVGFNSKIFSKIKEVKGERLLTIFPSPAHNELKISNALTGNVFYEIKDLNGRKVVSDQFNTISRTIDIKALKSGVYILELTNKDKTLTKKFIKQ